MYTYTRQAHSGNENDGYSSFGYDPKRARTPGGPKFDRTGSQIGITLRDFAGLRRTDKKNDT